MNATNVPTVIDLIHRLHQLHQVARIVEEWASPRGAADMRRRADAMLREAKEARS